MKAPPPDRQALAALVRRVAGAVLVPYYERVRRSRKRDGSVVTDADAALQDALRQALAETWPGIALLGEESSDQEQADAWAAGTGGLWVLDPLDGTSNFIAGLPFFSTSLAYLEEGEPRLGVVYDPVRDELFSAGRGAGAYLGDEPLRPREPGVKLRQCLAAIDLKRLKPELATRLVTDPPYASQRSLGSVALDWCWTAAGRFHTYLHGRQKLWDFAAGYLVLTEAGGHSATLTGEPVWAGTREPRSVVASIDRDLFDSFRAWLATAEN